MTMIAAAGQRSDGADQPKTQCSVLLVRNSDKAPFVHYFDITESDIKQGRFYDYILAIWGSMQDYRNIQPVLCQRLESGPDSVLASYPTLCQYVNAKVLEEERALGKKP